LGYVISVVAQSFNLDWAFKVPLYAIFIAFGVSGAIGIFFGVFPARSAAKMDPIEALRYE
jgi:putative ABC transport system permease protein